MKNVILCIFLHDLKPCKSYNSHYSNNHNHVTPESHENSLLVYGVWQLDTDKGNNLLLQNMNSFCRGYI